MNISALLLADSRFPGGGHAHSGGLEEAAARGLVRDEDDLPGFLYGRLRTAGELAAVFAAAAAHGTRRRAADAFWSTLDLELDARTPSLAQREASRTQGRATARAAGLALSNPHHAIALGAVIGAAGGLPEDAGLAAAYLSVSGPASAAVRLLGLDPFRVHAALAALSAELTATAQRAAEVAALPPSELPAPGSPGLDLLAEAHRRAHQREVRLFAS
jgi:urease accessory protein